MTTASLAREHRALMSAHRASRREDPDFYPTPPWAARAGAEVILELDPAASRGLWWEPACGAGHMAHGLRDYARVVLSDAYRYDPHHAVFDFVAGQGEPPVAAADWIVSNPPFNAVAPFVRAAQGRARRGVAMLLRVGGLESDERHGLIWGGEEPLTVFAPFVGRVPMHKGFWRPDGSTAAFYAWFVWLKPALRPRRFMSRIGGRWRAGTREIPSDVKARLTRDDDARLFGASAARMGGA